jgi:hypothetical protein
MPFEYALEDELQLELSSRPRIRVRHVKGRYGEYEKEIEAFDPVPPRKGTVLLTPFCLGRFNPQHGAPKYYQYGSHRCARKDGRYFKSALRIH